MKKEPNTLNEDNSKYVEQVHDDTFKDLDRYCSHLTDNTADAEDLRQETYRRFSTRVSKQGPLTEEGIEKPYLFTTAKNTQRSQQHRRNRLRVSSLQNDADEGAEDHKDREVSEIAGKTEYVEYTAAVRRSTYFDRFRTLIPIIESKLTPEEWRLIGYRWAHCMSFEEIAARTGKPRNEVAYTTSKARAKARYWARKLLKQE